MADTRYVELNVGGSRYTTSLETLTRYPESMLGTMFSQENVPLGKDKSGRYIIDRDGPAFRYVLNFLRGGNLNLPTIFSDYEQLMEEVDFYQLDDMKELLQLRVKTTQDAGISPSCSFPDMDKTTVRANNNQVFVMPSNNEWPKRKIQSIAQSYGSRCWEKSPGTWEYALECDPTTFRQLLNFQGRPKADHMPRSKEELRRLREAADKYQIKELKHALNTNIHMMPTAYNI